MPLGINVGQSRTAKPRKLHNLPSRPDDKDEVLVERRRPDPGPAPSAGQFIAMARQALRAPSAG